MGTLNIRHSGKWFESVGTRFFEDELEALEIPYGSMNYMFFSSLA